LPAAYHINCKVTNDDKDMTNGSEISNYISKITKAVKQPIVSFNFKVSDTKLDNDISYILTKAIEDMDCDISPFSSL